MISIRTRSRNIVFKKYKHLYIYIYIYTYIYIYIFTYIYIAMPYDSPGALAPFGYLDTHASHVIHSSFMCIIYADGGEGGHKKEYRRKFAGNKGVVEFFFR